MLGMVSPLSFELMLQLNVQEAKLAIGMLRLGFVS